MGGVNFEDSYSNEIRADGKLYWKSMNLTALRNYIRRATRHGQNEVNKTRSSSHLSYLIKEFLIRLGKSIGILSVPVVFIDVVGYPASVTGSSMERWCPKIIAKVQEGYQ
ncbi:BMA-IMMP-2 [Dirofilaria immitis]|nr:BMA-IMMP-2 [Dirofilaria immitis]